jgi:pimeloyl-ACP methyl ester carboxylesterase
MGHGKSEISIPPSQISIKRYADFVNGFLETLNIEKATLIGQSLGGAVCIQFCLDFPEKVVCLGLINTGAKLGVNPQLLSMLRKDFSKALRMGLENILGQKPEEATQIRRDNAVTKDMLETDPAVGLADFEACNKFDSRKKLSQIRKPTLIIGGSKDLMTPPWFHHYLHEEIENSTLRIIEGVGHLSMIEKPEEFNAILSEFLERHL